MDAPLGLSFLKKAELYEYLIRIDQQIENNIYTSSKESLWEFEKQILRWSYGYHMNLGSPITSDMISYDPKWGKLVEMGFEKNGKLHEKFRNLEKNKQDKNIGESCS